MQRQVSPPPPPKRLVGGGAVWSPMVHATGTRCLWPSSVCCSVCNAGAPEWVCPRLHAPPPPVVTSAACDDLRSGIFTIDANGTRTLPLPHKCVLHVYWRQRPSWRCCPPAPPQLLLPDASRTVSPQFWARLFGQPFHGGYACHWRCAHALPLLGHTLHSLWCTAHDCAQTETALCILSLRYLVLVKV